MRPAKYLAGLAICAGCDAGEPTVLADYDYPTSDGRASYHVKSVVIDGVTATPRGDTDRLPGASYWKIKFDPGNDEHGHYRGLQFLFHANGHQVRPIFAGARMEGIRRDECPTGLYL